MQLCVQLHTGPHSDKYVIGPASTNWQDDGHVVIRRSDIVRVGDHDTDPTTGDRIGWDRIIGGAHTEATTASKTASKTAAPTAPPTAKTGKAAMGHGRKLLSCDTTAYPNYAPRTGTCEATWTYQGKTTCGGECAKPEGGNGSPWCYLSGSSGTSYAVSSRVSTHKKTLSLVLLMPLSPSFRNLGTCT